MGGTPPPPFQCIPGPSTGACPRAGGRGSFDPFALGTWFNLVWFGQHPARGPTVSRRLKAEGMGRRGATSLPWRLPAQGVCPCRDSLPPGVWHAPGIDQMISRLRFGCPTAGPTIPFPGRWGWGEGAPVTEPLQSGSLRTRPGSEIRPQSGPNEKKLSKNFPRERNTAQTNTQRVVVIIF